MIVGWHERADDAAVGYVHAGKQGRSPVTLVIVRHGSTAPLLPSLARGCARAAQTAADPPNRPSGLPRSALASGLRFAGTTPVRRRSVGSPGRPRPAR